MTNSSSVVVWASLASVDGSHLMVKVPSAFSVTLLYGAVGLAPVGSHSESEAVLPVV